MNLIMGHRLSVDSTQNVQQRILQRTNENCMRGSLYMYGQWSHGFQGNYADNLHLRMHSCCRQEQCLIARDAYELMYTNSTTYYKLFRDEWYILSLRLLSNHGSAGHTSLSWSLKRRCVRIGEAEKLARDTEALLRGTGISRQRLRRP